MPESDSPRAPSTSGGDDQVPTPASAPPGGRRVEFPHLSRGRTSLVVPPPVTQRRPSLVRLQDDLLYNGSVAASEEEVLEE